MTSKLNTDTKYNQLLEAWRQKNGLLDRGWTLAGRCEMVGREILERLDQLRMAGEESKVLLEVLDCKVLPSVSAQYRGQLQEQLTRISEHVKQTSEQELLHSVILGSSMSMLYFITDELTPERSEHRKMRHEVLQSMHSLFVEKPKGTPDNEYVMGQIENSLYEICLRTRGERPLDIFMSLMSILNRENVSVQNAYALLNAIKNTPQQMRKAVIDSIPALLNEDPQCLVDHKHMHEALSNQLVLRAIASGSDSIVGAFAHASRQRNAFLAKEICSLLANDTKPQNGAI